MKGVAPQVWAVCGRGLDKHGSSVTSHVRDKLESTPALLPGMKTFKNLTDSSLSPIFT